MSGNRFSDCETVEAVLRRFRVAPGDIPRRRGGPADSPSGGAIHDALARIAELTATPVSVVDLDADELRRIASILEAAGGMPSYSLSGRCCGGSFVRTSRRWVLRIGGDQ